MKPCISIIIPNFNGVPFLMETIQSIQAQTFTDWELLFVDDGSTDDSIYKVQEFAANDARIIIIENHTGRKGGSVCRNLGLFQASGDYILFMDADDLLTPECLQNRLNVIHGKELDAVIFAMDTFRENVGDFNFVWKPIKEGALEAFLSHRLPWQTMCPIWRRDFVLRQNGFDERYPRLQDVEFHTRCLLDKSFRFEVYPERIDCHYRIGVDRASEVLRVEKLRGTLTGFNLYLEQFHEYTHGGNSGQQIHKSLVLGLFSAVERLCRARRTKIISNQEYKDLSELLVKTKLWSQYTLWRIALIRLYWLVFGHIGMPAKGFNKIIRWVLAS